MTTDAGLRRDWTPTEPTMIQCECGARVPRAPAYMHFPCAHMSPWWAYRYGIPAGVACENTGLHSSIDQALNMEQLLRDVESW